MKIQVCAGARCTMMGSDIIYNRLEDIKSDIERYKGREGIEIEEIEIEQVNCLGQCKIDKKSSPVVMVDEKVFTSAKSEVVMEYIMDKAFEANFDK